MDGTGRTREQASNQYIDRMFRALLDGSGARGAALGCTLCAACGRGAAQRLCADCLAANGRLGPQCCRCALPTGSTVAACGRCLADPPAFDATLAALPYAFPWDGLLRRLKYHAALDLAPALAAPLAERVRQARCDDAAPAPDVVVPVPLMEARLRQRGFNQAWELARRVAESLRLPADSGLLERCRDTPAQARLGRAQRRLNLEGAFAVPGAARGRLAGRRIALVDDVMTTGATADAAAGALRAAGAAEVQVWVVARTPPPPDDRP
jgi:ComF family protein